MNGEDMVSVKANGGITQHLIYWVQLGGQEGEEDFGPCVAHFFCGQDEETSGSGSLKTGVYKARDATCKECISKLGYIEKHAPELVP